MKKVQILLAPILLLSIPLFAVQASAQSICQPREIMYEAGWQISGPKMSVLRDSRKLDRNKGVSSSAMETRIENHINSFVKESGRDLKGITANKLANIIVRAADATGVDATVLTSIVKKESIFCVDRYNEGGGDSGCMQFTTVAVQELKHQFGLNGAGQHGAGVPAILKAQVMKFFAPNPSREAAFYSWLRSSTNNMRVSLRTGSNQDIDILAGAILLKINLAVSRGNYAAALQAYNGSRAKAAYARDVQAKAMKVNFTGDCMDDVNFSREIYGTMCEITDDKECFLNEDPNFRDVVHTNINWT